MSQNKQNGTLAAQTIQNSPAVPSFNDQRSLGFCVQSAGHEKNLSQLDSPYGFFPFWDDTLLIWDTKRDRIVHVLAGHEAAVRGASFSPDGRRLATAGNDATVRIWDVSSGQCTHILRGHGAGVRSVSLGPDGRHALSGSNDATARYWDVDSGRCLLVLPSHGVAVRNVSISPDGRRALTRDRNRTLRLWCLRTGECLERHKDYQEILLTECVCPNGRLVIWGKTIHRSLRQVDLSELWEWFDDPARPGHRPPALRSVFVTTGGRRRTFEDGFDDTLRLWDLRTGQCLRVFENPDENGFRTVHFWSGGRRAVSTSITGAVFVWDFNQAQPVHIVASGGYHHGFSVHPDDRRAVLASERAIELLDLETGERLRRSPNEMLIRDVSITPDGRRAIYAAQFSPDLGIWDVKTGQTLGMLVGHQSIVTCVSACPSGRHAVSGTIRGGLRLWNVMRDELLPLEQAREQWFSNVNVSPDGRHATLKFSQEVQVWDLENGQALSSFHKQDCGSKVMDFTPDARHAVSEWCFSNFFILWNLESGQVLRNYKYKYKYASAEYFDICLSPTGRHAVMVGDGVMKLWDLKDGRNVTLQQPHPDPNISRVQRLVRVSPDGCHTFSLGPGSSLEIWNLRSGQNRMVYTASPVWVQLFCLAPDGRRALLACHDATVRLVDLVTGQCLRVFEGHVGEVTYVGMGSDGRLAISTGNDQTLRLWDTHSGRHLAVHRFAEPVVAAFSPNNRQIFCGMLGGQARIFNLTNVHPDPPILTPVRIWRITCPPAPRKDESVLVHGRWDQAVTCLCPLCATLFPLMDATAEVIYAYATTLAPNASPCLHLPETAYTDPRLLAPCPHCDAPIRFNPFVCDERTVKLVDNFV